MDKIHVLTPGISASSFLLCILLPSRYSKQRTGFNRGCNRQLYSSQLFEKYNMNEHTNISYEAWFWCFPHASVSNSYWQTTNLQTSL